jgi:mono/diheme cytochrome c family protein
MGGDTPIAGQPHSIGAGLIGRRGRYLKQSEHRRAGVQYRSGTADGCRMMLKGERMVQVAYGLILLSIAFAAPVLAQDAKASGEKVFTEQKCSICHSLAGKGNTKGPLDDVGSRLSSDDIRAWITDAKAMTVKTKSPRKPEMKAYSLPKDEVDALVAYLSAMKKK